MAVEWAEDERASALTTEEAESNVCRTSSSVESSELIEAAGARCWYAARPGWVVASLAVKATPFALPWAAGAPVVVVVVVLVVVEGAEVWRWSGMPTMVGPVAACLGRQWTRGGEEQSRGLAAGLGSSRVGGHGRPRCLRRSSSNGKSKLRAWRLSAGPDGGGRPMSIELWMCALYGCSSQPCRSEVTLLHSGWLPVADLPPAR